MEGKPAIYLGRIVDKKNFRVFIYGANGERRLVESWEEFEANMQSGIWFATLADAELSKALVEESNPVEVVEKPKAKPQKKPKSKAKSPTEKVVEEPMDGSFDAFEDDGSVIEVTDDFLPQEIE